MRLVGQCALLFVSLWGSISLLAQEPAPAETPATQTPDAPPATDQRDRDKDLRPLTPEQQREQEIRQFDPLDRTDDKTARGQDTKDKDKDKARDQKKDETDAPLPGSIAASDRDAQRAGPRVAEGDAT